MDAHEEIEPALRRRMEELGIDVPLTLSILGAYNRGEYDHVRPISVSGFPEVDGRSVIDFTGDVSMTVSRQEAADRLGGAAGVGDGRSGSSLLPEPLVDAALGLGTETTVDGRRALRYGQDALRTIGLFLMPRVAYGVLNGGSATSYADETKNRGFSPALFELLAPEFERMAEVCGGRAKGLTPAFIQPDGGLGPSFLLLKMRSLLLTAAASREAIDRFDPGSSARLPSPLLPFFQMTSVGTDEQLAAAYGEYRHDPLLAALIRSTGLDPTEAVGAMQPMIAALTHSELGRPKRIFDSAHGRPGETLALPGGHGQGFAVLADTYRRLHSGGKRFVYLGNVDNLCFLPDPVEVAYLALSGAEAGFEFAWKTPVDVKGGILVRDRAGRLNCADIGPAVDPQDVAAAEAAGTPILFNAATGLFDLDYLVPNLERIARELPTRFTDQEKDAGRYSQAEQVTWEVIGMLDRFLVFSVRKHDRLLAAKLLMEALMTSGIRLDDPAYPTGDTPAADLRAAASTLHDGLVERLRLEYGLRLSGGRWAPNATGAGAAGREAGNAGA